MYTLDPKDLLEAVTASESSERMGLAWSSGEHYRKVCDRESFREGPRPLQIELFPSRKPEGAFSFQLLLERYNTLDSVKDKLRRDLRAAF